MTDPDKAIRQGEILGKAIYWVMVLFVAGIAIFGTAMAAQKKAVLGTPAIIVALSTLVLWVIVGYLAWRGVKKN